MLQVLLTLPRQDGDTRQSVNVRLKQIMDRFVDVRLELSCFATPRMRVHRLLATGPAGQVALMVIVYWSTTLAGAQKLLASGWDVPPRSKLGHPLPDRATGNNKKGGRT